MTLSDSMAYRQVIGCLMYKPLLFLEYPDIQAQDFDFKPARVCLFAIRNLYEAGATSITPLEVDQEIENSGSNATQTYKSENGLNFLKEAYEYAQLGNFDVYYNRLKKNSLLRKLKARHYDISEFYIEDKDAAVDPARETAIIKKLEKATLSDILNSVEKNYNEIRDEFINGRNKQGNPAEGVMTLIDELRTSPSIGPSLEGEMFSTVCRGARDGCFFLKSASTSAGKSRTSIFDACHLCYPKRWSKIEDDFVEILDSNGNPYPPRKVLFIVTEMDKEELQTIMLAYLSGVDEDHILTGQYPLGELTRVRKAARIMEEYSGYFLIEEISDPNLENVQSTIKKYATVDDVKYVFFDYIHSTASRINQFAKNNIREDVILMMMANQLKQIAHDYKIFIFSATQVNALGIADEEMEFKDEKTIRGSKAIADKCDMGYVMTRISDKGWLSLKADLQPSVREGVIPYEYLEEGNRPTHVLDIYKMRRGRYKMIRIWTRIHLGTGERQDLFITNAVNQPILAPLDIFHDGKRIVEIKKEAGE